RQIHQRAELDIGMALQKLSEEVKIGAPLNLRASFLVLDIVEGDVDRASVIRIRSGFCIGSRGAGMGEQKSRAQAPGYPHAASGAEMMAHESGDGEVGSNDLNLERL